LLGERTFSDNQLVFSKNKFSGSLPRYGRKQLPKLKSLLCEDNHLTGKIPPKWSGLRELEVMDVGGNSLNGTIPTIFGALTNLREFNIVGNSISGTIPSELMLLTKLESLMLSENQLRGTIPGGDDTVPHRAMREPEAGFTWSQLSDLQFFHASDNFLTSTLPPDLFYGLAITIQRQVKIFFLFAFKHTWWI
jgi:Leucine-rich repeat (LRR) protein